MSASPPATSGGLSTRAARVALALLCVGGAVCAAAAFARDLAAWGRVRRFVVSSGLARTAPSDAAGVLLESAPDLAGTAAAALDRRSRKPGSEGGGSAAARALLLAGAADRPGWPENRVALAAAEPGGDRSRAAYRLAARGAPGSTEVQTALARADLAAWRRLSPPARREAEDAFRAALRDPGFAAAEFGAVASAVGKDGAIALLPDRAGPLGAAAGRLGFDGDLAGALALLRRADDAERRERDAELRELGARSATESAEAIQAACDRFFDRHAFSELDDAAGRRQLARLLDVWPAEPPRSWARDRRARLASFFLDGRGAEIAPSLLLRTVEALTGVPEEVRARALLRAGDRTSAEELARGINPFVAPEWIRFFVELAADRAARGDFDGARAVLSRLPPSIRDSCDALLVRRDLARAAGEAAELAAVGERLGELRAGAGAGAGAPGAGSFAICVDPRASAGESLEVSVGAGAPALFAYGWNGGRSGFARAPEGIASFSVPLAGLSGQRTLRVAAFAGSSERALRASLRARS